MAQVFNKYHTDVPDGCVNIMRGTPWGNPFVIGAKDDDGKPMDRATVCARYRKEVFPLLNDIWLLRGKNLLCCCKPAECHGDCLCEAANRPLIDVSDLRAFHRPDLSALIWAPHIERTGRIPPGNVAGDIVLPGHRSIRFSIEQWTDPQTIKPLVFVFYSAEEHTRPTDEECRAVAAFSGMTLGREMKMNKAYIRRFMLASGQVAE